MSSPELEVLFLWHLHQPYYGHPQDGSDFHLPWTRLHAVKAYYDMARHLQERPGVQGTFNFSGSLLRQLQEISEGRRDRWWRWCEGSPDELDGPTRVALLQHFFSISHRRGVAPLPRFAELYELRARHGVHPCAEQFSPEDFLDLQVLFHLAWSGHFAAVDFPLIEDLRRKGSGFTLDDRRALLDTHVEITSRVLPLYRELAESGQIEISVSPMYHPIVPLVIDTDEARKPSPDRPTPPRYQAPDDATVHVVEALDLAESIFGHRPRGVWPSEGSVSPAARQVFADAGVDWIATDEEILRRSLTTPFDRDRHLWKPWRVDGGSPSIFFRDRWLSDQVGFVYSNNPAETAASDLISHLQGIRRSLSSPVGAVSIILDGENPWEHFEDSGFPFLSALYEGLEEAPGLRTTTFSKASPPPGELTDLASGSWILGNFQIWIGHPETNSGWELLRLATDALQDAARDGADDDALQRARALLHVAQGSDWFWWYGDDFSSEQDDDFDALFRSLLIGVFETLDMKAPPEFHQPIHHHVTPDEEEATVMAPAGRLDSSGSLDWDRAGQVRLGGGHGAMYETFRPLDEIHYGPSSDAFHLRLKPGPDFSENLRFRITFSHPDSEAQEVRELTDPSSLHTELPFEALGLSPSHPPAFRVEVLRNGLEVLHFPVRNPWFLPR